MEIDNEMKKALDRAFTERPKWLSDLHRALFSRGFSHDGAITAIEAVAPHVIAAERRGRQGALESFICGACGHRVLWIDCPTGGWWSHAVHPADGHDAAECLPGLDSP